MLLILVLCSALTGCTNRTDRDREAIASSILNRHELDIINSNYGGGENFDFEILEITNNSYDDFDAKVRLTFKGQYTGIEYWAKGNLHVELSTKSYQYTSLERSTALINAMQIENKLKEKGVEILNNALQDNNDASTIPVDTPVTY
jgi:hypothetical protein